jgi:hypothetical protein
MRRNLIASFAVGLILAFATLQGAQAGEKSKPLPFAAKVNSKSQNPNSKGERASLSPKVSVSARTAELRSGAQTARGLQSNAAGEYSFSPVSPLAHKSEVGNEPSARVTYVAAQTKEAGPATAPSERKTITFFRFSNSKLGEVSVQPVVGGVNGAQLAVGF